MDTLSTRFDDIITGLCTAIVARSPVLPHWLASLAWHKLNRIAIRIAAIFARLHARTYRVPRRCPPARLRTSVPRKPVPPRRLPRQRAWLHRMLPADIAQSVAQLIRLMADPAFEEAVCTAPAMRRDLRALCAMLGLTPPEYLHTPETGCRRPYPGANKPDPAEKPAATTETRVPPMPSPTFARTPEPWLDVDPSRTRPARGRAAAATAHPMASWAAVTILHQGGSAIDAAIAAQAMLTLVEPNASGIGGGAIILVHDGIRVRAFDGLSAAPARVTAKLALDFDGRIVPSDRAVYGGRTVGIPGALRALERAHATLGKLPWSTLFAPAIEAAHEGFALAPYLWRALQENPAVRDEAMARTLYCRDAAALPPGTTLRNAALADTLEDIAKHGADALYRGDLADRICRAVAADPFPGTITRVDLESYRAIERAPLIYAHGAGHIATAPLPAYGGIAAGQILGLATALGMHGLDHTPDEDAAHLLAECGRVAHADRAPYADPDHVDIDTAHLLDPHYLARRSKLIDRARRTDRIPAGRADGASSMTSHLSVADGKGQVVAMTSTINQNFGARIAVGGFYLNNVMTNFANEPVLRGRPDPNALAPGKRARTTIAPSIVLDMNGAPTAALGAGGGYRIIGIVANALLRLAAGQQDPQALLAAPHILNWSGLTELEPALEHLAPGLTARGHWLSIRRLDGGTQCVIIDTNGRISAGGDPRRDGAGMAIKP